MPKAPNHAPLEQPSGSRGPGGGGIGTADLVAYLDELLSTASVPDYPNALNGLQMENRGKVRFVAAAVDCSVRTVNDAAATGADLLLVHHGMFWGGALPVRGPAYHRLHTLITHDIAVYASHLPLDRHPVYGNNVLLAAKLGLEPSGEFAMYRGVSIGVRGNASIATATVLNRARSLAEAYAGTVRHTPIGIDRRTDAWGICTGAGASSDTLREAAALGIDTLVVGEGPHHTAVEADELGIAVIYAGHYATETLGVRALGEHLANRFGVSWTFVDAPTGL